MAYYFNRTIQGDFNDTISRITQRLSTIGFGVLTTIDVQKTLREKIGFEFKPYVILGACNPHFASKALSIEEKLGVFLPCNVVVTDQGNGNIEVMALNPMSLAETINNEELLALMKDVSCKIEDMIKEL